MRQPGTLFLDAGELSAFGAESLLIGGVRETTADGTLVTVKTNNLTVDNSGEALTGSDVILVANENLTLADGATIEQSGDLIAPAETLLFGDAEVDGSGNGVLLRVTSDPTAEIVRSGVDSSTTPSEVIGRDVRVSGASVTLDSTVRDDARLECDDHRNRGQPRRGQISIVLPDAPVAAADDRPGSFGHRLGEPASRGVLLPAQLFVD